jgi:hypothetical protein
MATLPDGGGHFFIALAPELESQKRSYQVDNGNGGEKLGSAGGEGGKTATPPYAVNWWRFLAG